MRRTPEVVTSRVAVASRQRKNETRNGQKKHRLGWLFLVVVVAKRMWGHTANRASRTNAYAIFTLLPIRLRRLP